MEKSLAQALAEFTVDSRPEHFPRRAREMAVDAITDCVGCMLAGSREPLSGSILRVVADVTGRLAVPLVGTMRSASPEESALHGGAIAHALDYDDTNHPAYAHPSAVIVPAAFATARLGAATGADVVTAYILGLEVFGKLGRALNTAHYKRGWHATCSFGTLAAVVVAGRLLRLDVPQMTLAIGIAASAASGLRVNFGTMVKPLHAGYAARNGVLAAMLAREGFDASELSLDHQYGYCNVFNDGLPKDLAPLRSWGEPLEILTDYGLALKPYPSCGATHPGIEAALEIHRRLQAAPIKSVRAGVPEMAFAPLIHVMPHIPLEGKFSLHYCLAVALLEGTVGLASFTQEKVDDPRIRALIPKIAMEVDERVRHESEFSTHVRVETEDGAVHEAFCPLAMGKPERWFSPAQMRSKFLDCGTVLNAPDAVLRAFGRLRELDAAPTLEPLFESLRFPES